MIIFENKDSLSEKSCKKDNEIDENNRPTLADFQL